MDTRFASDRRCIRASDQRRSDDPFLLGSRPSTPALHRRDHLNLSCRHRTIPRNSPRTSTPLLRRPQGGLHRMRTLLTKAHASLWEFFPLTVFAVSALVFLIVRWNWAA